MSRHYGTSGIALTALNAIDKPSEFRTSPESVLEGMFERYGPEAFQEALAQIHELLALNSHDVVALGAERLLENLLAR